MWKFLSIFRRNEYAGLTAKARVLKLLESKECVTLPELLEVDPAEYRTHITILRKEGRVIENKVTYEKRWDPSIDGFKRVAVSVYFLRA